jgi:hypothetical protein
MGSVTNTITFVVTLILAVIIGNLFLAEVKKARERKDPWYKPYFSLPGLLILAALCIPVLLWLFRR